MNQQMKITPQDFLWRYWWHIETGNPWVGRAFDRFPIQRAVQFKMNQQITHFKYITHSQLRFIFLGSQLTAENRPSDRSLLALAATEVMKELFQAGAHVLDVDGTASTDLKALARSPLFKRKRWMDRWMRKWMESLVFLVSRNIVFFGVKIVVKIVNELGLCLVSL